MSNQIIISFCVANRNSEQLKRNLVSMFEAENERSEDDIESRSFERIQNVITEGECVSLLTVGIHQTSVLIKSVYTKRERTHFLLALAGNYQTTHKNWFESTESINEFEQFIEKVVISAGCGVKKAASNVEPLAVAVLIEDDSGDQSIFDNYQHKIDDKYQGALDYGKQLWEMSAV